jgi:hypothetical protein
MYQPEAEREVLAPGSTDGRRHSVRLRLRSDHDAQAQQIDTLGSSLSAIGFGAGSRLGEGWMRSDVLGTLLRGGGFGRFTPSPTTHFNRFQQRSTPLRPKQIRSFIEIY